MSEENCKEHGSEISDGSADECSKNQIEHEKNQIKHEIQRNARENLDCINRNFQMFSELVNADQSIYEGEDLCSIVINNLKLLDQR